MEEAPLLILLEDLALARIQARDEVQETRRLEDYCGWELLFAYVRGEMVYVATTTPVNVGYRALTMRYMDFVYEVVR